MECACQMTRSSRSRLWRRRRFQLRYLQGTAPFTPNTSSLVLYQALQLDFQGPSLWGATSARCHSMVLSRLSDHDRWQMCPLCETTRYTPKQCSLTVQVPIPVNTKRVLMMDPDLQHDTGWLACVPVVLQASAVLQSEYTPGLLSGVCQRSSTA